MTLPARIITTLFIIRVLYAASIVVAGFALRLGVLPDGLMTGHLADIVLTAPPALVTAWTIYVAGYLLAGLLLIRRDARALPVYAAAFCLDLLAWIYLGTVSSYELALGGLSEALDHVFNLVDICLLGALIWLRSSGWLRQAAPAGRPALP